MPDAFYYRTFPLFKDGAFSSPNSIYIDDQNDGNAKRKLARMEPIGLGTPAKSPKSEIATAAIAKGTPWISIPSSKASRMGKANDMQQIIKPIIDEIKQGFQRSDNKYPISLASADGAMSHVPPCPQAREAIVRAALRNPHTIQYTHASGSLEARRAIAIHHSVPGYPLVRLETDVIVTNGCSGALEISLASLLGPGTSLLVPKPGFPLYEKIAVSLGASIVEYDLDPNRNWECDLDHLEAIVTKSFSENIRAMVINNPSSHGAVFSEHHLLRILDFARKYRLPIISDEVYGDLTFGSHTFHPMANVAAKHGRTVPVITTSGLSKQFLVPGWRLGWAVFHDNQWGSLKEVRAGAHKLAGLRHGLSHLQQSAIRELLVPPPPSSSSKSGSGVAGWKNHLQATLERQAKVLYSNLDDCDGLETRWIPRGSMYGLVGLDLDRFSHSSSSNNNNESITIHDDVDFCRALVREENVFCLPGSSFGVPGTIRVAFAAPESTLGEASRRIARFCKGHTAKGEREACLNTA